MSVNKAKIIAICFWGLTLVGFMLFLFTEVPSVGFVGRVKKVEASEDTSISAGINNIAPSFTDGPSDGGSCTTTPTNEGTNVSFSATSSDDNSDDWKLLVCSTSSDPTASTSMPTCAGGDTNKWCVSSSWASSTVQNTCTHAATSSDSESNAWWAWCCDNNSSSATCSTSSSQGTGDNGSPFYVNHKPLFTGINDAPDPVDLGNTVTFSATSSDNDIVSATDTVALYVCKAEDGSSSGCGGGGTWCTSTLASSNPSCTSTATGASAQNYYAYIFDNHSLGATNNGTSSTFTVNNATPTVGSITPGSVTLTEGSTTTATSTCTVSDNNGYEDLASVIGVFYDSNATNSSCSSDYNSCYPSISCATSNCASTQCDVSCQADVWYYANASNDWMWKVTATDDSSAASSTESATTTIDSLIALEVTEASINYGSISLAATSSQATSTIENTGNTALDSLISGTDMSCSAGSITVSQQHYSTSIGFGWAAGTALATTSATTSLDLSQRTNGATTDPVYWLLQTPSSGVGGSCTGTNTFAATQHTPPVFCSGDDGDHDSTSTVSGDLVYCDNSDRLWTPTADLPATGSNQQTYKWSTGTFPSFDCTPSSCIDGGSSCLACNYCDTLDYAGYGAGEWELPNCASGTADSGCVLWTLYDTSGNCSTWDPNAQTSTYWSSTEYDDTIAYSVHSLNGFVYYDDKDFYDYVRCVRGQ